MTAVHTTQDAEPHVVDDDLVLPPLFSGVPPRLSLGALGLVVALVVAAVTVLAGGSTPGSGPLRLSVADGGAVTVVEPDGSEIRVGSGQSRRLELGSRVLAQEGSASLTLAEGGSAELRAGFAGASDSEVEFGAGTIEVISGELLVESPAPTVVAGPAMVVPTAGVQRIERTLGAAVAVFAGTVEVTSAGSTLTVPAYRQVSVAAERLVPSAAVPLSLDPTDPWDRRYFAEAMAASSALTALSVGVDGQISALSPSDLLDAVPSLAADTSWSPSLFDPSLSPGELLIGAVAASLADDAPGTELADRWRQVFDLRARGAEWGVVLLDVGASVDGVVDAVSVAVNRLLGPVVGTPPPVTPTSAPPSTSPTTSPPTSPTTSPPTSPTTQPPPDTTTTTEPDLIGGILDPLGPGPSPAPDTGEDDEPVDPLSSLIGGLLS